MRLRTMRVSWCRLVIFLIIALAILQVLHMTLLSRLEARDKEAKQSHMVRIMEGEVQQLYLVLTGAIESSRIIDSSGIYKIVNDITGSSERIPKHVKPDVTLVSQCSVNHLHYILDLVSYWDGPISIALFIPEPHVSTALAIILRLHQCLPSLRNQLQLHMVFPLTQEFHRHSSIIWEEFEQLKCNNFKDNISDKIKSDTNYALGTLEYPNNLLRNVGIKNVLTEYIFVIDIDMTPSMNLHSSFVDFAQRYTLSQMHGSDLDSIVNTAFVVPAFELQNQVQMPGNKPELVQLWTQGVVRPFYQDICWKCQRYTDYNSWKNISQSDLLDVAYEVEWQDPWEPFFITPVSMPQYDERFKQYGFNRISQVCELHVAAFRFAVMNHAFLIHRGFKTATGFHPGKAAEQERNRLLFRQFKTELKTKYPDSDRRC